MNKAQLVDLVAQKTKLTKVQSESVIDATLDVIQNAVAGGDEVKLVGFGTFSKLERKTRKGRNPRTGEEISIPGATVPRFKPGKEFKDSITNELKN